MKHINNSMKMYECTYNGKTKTILAANPRIAQMDMSAGLSSTWSSKNADKVIVKEIK